MTVIVTTMPGNIAQIINPATGRITYKCKGDTAFMDIEAFGGIVKFNCKNSKAIVSGPVTRLQDCRVIRPEDSEYMQARKAAIESAIKFNREKISDLQQDLQSLENSIRQD